MCVYIYMCVCVFMCVRASVCVFCTIVFIYIHGVRVSPMYVCTHFSAAAAGKSPSNALKVLDRILYIKPKWMCLIA